MLTFIYLNLFQLVTCRKFHVVGLWIWWVSGQVKIFCAQHVVDLEATSVLSIDGTLENKCATVGVCTVGVDTGGAGG